MEGGAEAPPSWTTARPRWEQRRARTASPEWLETLRTGGTGKKHRGAGDGPRGGVLGPGTPDPNGAGDKRLLGAATTPGREKVQWAVGATGTRRGEERWRVSGGGAEVCSGQGGESRGRPKASGRKEGEPVSKGRHRPGVSRCAFLSTGLGTRRTPWRPVDESAEHAGRSDGAGNRMSVLKEQGHTGTGKRGLLSGGPPPPGPRREAVCRDREAGN